MPLSSGMLQCLTFYGLVLISYSKDSFKKASTIAFCWNVNPLDVPRQFISLTNTLPKNVLKVSNYNVALSNTTKKLVGRFMSLEKHVLQLSNFSRTLGTTSLAHWNQRQSEAIKCYNDCPGQQVIDDFIQISSPTVSFESFNIWDLLTKYLF